jgi:hypothetical protein
MKLIAYLQSSEVPLIRPAPPERPWMDDTPMRFAYRCLPLNIANAHGWEVVTPARIEAEWSGGQGLDAVRIDTDAPAHLRPVSHFGSGVLTFHVGCLFKTEPEIELWVTGPANRPKHGIAPLTGVVETDWSPFTFTMNWLFTAPGRVVFEKGEPFCFFFPISRQILAAAEPEFRPLAEAGALAEEFAAWQRSRNDFNKDLGVAGSRAQEEGWQRTYFQGQTPSGEAAPKSHRTRQKARAFKRPGTAGG